MRSHSILDKHQTLTFNTLEMHSWIHHTILLVGAFSHFASAQQNRWLNPTTNLMNGIYHSELLNTLSLLLSAKQTYIS